MIAIIRILLRFFRIVRYLCAGALIARESALKRSGPRPAPTDFVRTRNANNCPLSIFVARRHIWWASLILSLLIVGVLYKFLWSFRFQELVDESELCDCIDLFFERRLSPNSYQLIDMPFGLSAYFDLGEGDLTQTILSVQKMQNRLLFLLARPLFARPGGFHRASEAEANAIEVMIASSKRK